jgi:hypothetical protein
MIEVDILRAERAEAGATRIAFAAKRQWGYPRLIELGRRTNRAKVRARNDVGAAKAGSRRLFPCAVREGAEASLKHLWCRLNGWDWVGARLFAHAVLRSRERGYSLLTIESDPNAQGFYERMGARKVRERLYTLEGATRALPVREMAP